MKGVEYYLREADGRLKAAEELRENADYGGIEEVSREEAERVLRDARRFVERMKEAAGRAKRP